METWLTAQGADIRYTRFFQSATLPSSRSVDLVIAMGGPMSVNDDQKYPWLKQEKRFIAEAIEGGVATIGVCLGAQLIANAMGAQVFANAHREIGWFPIEAVDTVDTGADVFPFPRQMSVFHWHGETFALPPGAVHLARSAGCENQAFQIGKNVIGMQFHLETTPANVELLLQNCRSELTAGPYIQTEQAMRATPASAYAAINTLMSEVLRYVTR